MFDSLIPSDMPERYGVLQNFARFLHGSEPALLYKYMHLFVISSITEVAVLTGKIC